MLLLFDAIDVVVVLAVVVAAIVATDLGVETFELFDKFVVMAHKILEIQRGFQRHVNGNVIYILKFRKIPRSPVKTYIEQRKTKS